MMVAQALFHVRTMQRPFQRRSHENFDGGSRVARRSRSCDGESLSQALAGFPPGKCAVPSGGSGPAMRKPQSSARSSLRIHEKRSEFVLASSRLTHKGWQAETAALAIAEAAASVVEAQAHLMLPGFFRLSAGFATRREWLQLLSQIESALERSDSVSDFVRALGLEKGVSGYSLHVVPVALYAWLRAFRRFPRCVSCCLKLWRPTRYGWSDSRSLVRRELRDKKYSAEWIDGLIEWPRSVAFIRAVAQRLADQKEARQPLAEVRFFSPGLIPRNISFSPW